MKHQEDTAPARGGAQRYRYWTEPPSELALKAAVLGTLLPEPARGQSFTAETVTLPAGEVFSTNVPRISIHRLAELFPDQVKSQPGTITLPVRDLALSYFLVEKSEELPPEPVVVEPEPLPTEPVAQEPAAPAPELMIPPPPIPKVRLPKPPVAAVPVVVPPPAEVEAIEPPPDFQPPDEVPPSPAGDPVALAEPPPAPAEIQLPGNAAAEQLSAARRSGFLRGIPLFRRKSPEVIPPPPPRGRAVPKTEVILPPPEPPADLPKASIVLPAMPGPVAESGAMAEIAPPRTVPEPPPKVPLPPPKPLTQRIAGDPGSAPVLVTETLASPEPRIEEQEALQALFLTEENLTVPRVLELCCTLPGITSCVLARGAGVIAAHNVPSHVDIVSLSANATEMLRAMRESSARMGVGAVPAVTLHTEKGVISFFHGDELALLVFHKDRGFVPGVREKMTAALAELAKARLALPPRS